MKEEIKNVWLAALRGQLSQKYKQVTGALQKKKTSHTSQAGFCCLGVLCDLSKLDGVNLEWSTKVDKYDGTVKFGSRKADLPPRAVYDWAGLHHTTAQRLAEMNDNGASFKEIANYIEKKL